MIGLRPRAWVATLVAAAAGSFVSGILLGGYLLQSTDAVPVEEIAFGLDSGFNWGDRSFAGGCLTISDRDTWEAFWEVHRTRLISPERPPPAVDFSRNAVLGCFLGFLSRSGHFIRITDVVGRDDGGYWVFVERNYTSQGFPQDANPYHLVQVPRPGGPSVFLDEATGGRLPTLTFVP